MAADFEGEGLMEIVFLWLALVGVVTWWASVWGRSVGFALLGSLVLSPLIWAVVLLVLGRNPDHPDETTPQTSAPFARMPLAAAADARGAHYAGRSSASVLRPKPPRAIPLPDGVVECSACSRMFSISAEDREAGLAHCPRCSGRVPLRDDVPLEEPMPVDPDAPVTIRSPATPDAAATCPHCKADVPIAFDDAKAGRATCPTCWRSFEITVG